jgi:hypothetical protein
LQNRSIVAPRNKLVAEDCFRAKGYYSPGALILVVACRRTSFDHLGQFSVLRADRRRVSCRHGRLGLGLGRSLHQQGVSYNAQAVVATESLLVIATDVVQAPNDKQQIAPVLEKVDALPEQLGRPETLLADNGYFSEANVMACAGANIEPLIATGRQPHHLSWRERFAAPGWRKKCNDINII